MVLGSKPDGGVQTYSYRVRKTIQSIKEIVGSHSDAEIYAMLKETNMDPNETTQKLLYQDPFHEVKRKKDKKKENTGNKVSYEPQKDAEKMMQQTDSHVSWDGNARRGGYIRSTLPGVSREFRVVRDNRLNQNISWDSKKVPIQASTSGNEQTTPNLPENSSPRILTNQKPSAARNSEVKLASDGVNNPQQSDSGHAQGHSTTNSHVRISEGTQSAVSNTTLLAQREVSQNSQMHSATQASFNSAIGVYSSSSDPVHVPSPDSRSTGTVGAIRREVGVVGVRRQTSESLASHSSVPNNSFSVASLGNDIPTSSESLGHIPSISKSNYFSQAPTTEHIMPNISGTRSFSSNQYNSKLHQPPIGHQKAPQPNREWKPKSNQKPSIIETRVTVTTSSPLPSHANNSTGSNVEETCLLDKLSQVNIGEDEHVVIPKHLRVPDAERTFLTFGSFGAELDSTKGFTYTFGHVEDSRNEPSISTLAPSPASTNEDASSGDQIDLVDGQARTSQSVSPASSSESEHPTPENNDSSSPQNFENYADIGYVQNNGPSYSPLELQQSQDPPSLPSFSEAYNPQPGYDVPFIRAMEDDVRGQGLASSPGAFSSHAANTSPPPSITMMQQQQQQQALAQQQSQLYPQVHISHFPNYVPYRQILSPLYVPPMAMPNYSSNAAYPHPSNGSSFLLMPGGSPHLSAGGLKYATSQYKPVPAGSPSGYLNYTNPAGYAISASGTLGGPTGLEDVTRIKYKDNNLYVPNPQAETPEIWIQQPPRDISSMQSAPYYNLSGQSPHAAYLPAHTGHPSFNATAQSSHVQYPGLYHPPPAPTMTNPHHMVHQQVPPGMGGNLGVSVAAPAGAQLGAFQHSQLGQLNWTSNF